MVTFKALPGVTFASSEAVDMHAWQALFVESAIQEFEADSDMEKLADALTTAGMSAADVAQTVAALPGRVPMMYA
jgi:hypothetical protein